MRRNSYRFQKGSISPLHKKRMVLLDKVLLEKEDLGVSLKGVTVFDIKPSYPFSTRAFLYIKSHQNHGPIQRIDSARYVQTRMLPVRAWISSLVQRIHNAKWKSTTSIASTPGPCCGRVFHPFARFQIFWPFQEMSVLSFIT